MKTTKTILLAGATGYIGQAVADALTDAGYRVIAPVRSRPSSSPTADKLAGCELLEVALTDTGAMTRALAGQPLEAVISCIASRSGEASDAWAVDFEANAQLLGFAQQHSARRFVLLSAICVQKPKLAFQHAKLKFERTLMDSGMDYAIVRPTAFFKSLSGQVNRVLNGKPFLVFGDGTRTSVKPISESDLARFMVRCIDQDEFKNNVLPIGGPGAAITPKAQGELLCEMAGKPVRIRSVPVGLFTVALALLAPLGWLIPRLAAKAELARIGRYYATESMLVWDEDRQQYDERATPEFGTDTLREHYARVLREGQAGQELGDHQLF